LNLGLKPIFGAVGFGIVGSAISAGLSSAAACLGSAFSSDVSVGFGSHHLQH
jgi:Na+-driven multidrug efflux pump